MLHKGLDWKRRKKAGKERDHPYFARGKNKSDSHLPKVQCLITDFTTVSMQSIARRMHERNFELQWFCSMSHVAAEERQRTWSIM